MVYGTGFGALNPTPADGQIARAPTATDASVTATIAGVPAEATSTPGRPPSLIAGVVQINIRVPEGLAGDFEAPVALSAGTASTTTRVTVSIQ